jgi:uncharacterized membrane protein YkvA (DUF1232 family)
MDNDAKEKKSVMNLESIAGNRNDPGFFRELWQQARLVYALLRDPEVPFYLKLLPFTAVLYLIFPLDLIPDLVPVFGQLDDLTVLLVGAKLFVDMSPPHIVARHRDQIRVSDGFSPKESVDEKIIIDPQPDFKENKKE